MSRRGASPSRRQRPQVALKERLAVARAQVRAYGKALKAMPAPEWGSTIEADARAGQPRFVQVFNIYKGGYQVLGALDASGQIWERHLLLDMKVIKEEWWEKMPMVRR